MGERRGEAWLDRNREDVETASKAVVERFGTLPAASFAPLRLQEARRVMIEAGTCARRTINKKVATVRRAFCWAVSQEFFPASVAVGLDTVASLRRGEFGVREGKPREPVTEDVMRATLAYLSSTVAGIVELLWHTGARPSEVLGLCPKDIDRSGETWKAVLVDHKNARHGKARMLFFGPAAREVLKRFLDRVPLPAADEPIFSPQRAMAEHNARKRASRKRHRGPRIASGRPV